MIFKNFFISNIFLLILFCSFSNLTAQNTIEDKNNFIPLSQLLDSISSKHKIYFTYSSKLLKFRKINNVAFKNLSLKKSIILLRKLTSLHFDNLGNKYYVIYSDKYKSNIKHNYNLIIIDSLKKDVESNSSNYLTIKGIILTTNSIPINQVNIIEQGTNNGTISLNDGSFLLKLKKNNPIEISHIGYDSKVVKPLQKFHTIVLSSGLKLEEVHIIGSRNNLRDKKDSPVPTDIIEIKKIASKSGLFETNQFLQHSVPSFNATKQSGADGADHIVPATYRGLGPDQTLVLINGKRRHQASLINLYGTRGRGNSGTDLNSIPSSAIKKIEILKDGAAAQYGSDAIAGVINIVLKDTINNIDVNTLFGFNNASINKNKQSSNIDGFTYKLNFNYGSKILDKGFINISTELLSQDHTFRLGTDQRNKYGNAATKNISFFSNLEVPFSKKAKFYAFGGYNFRNSEAFAFTRKPQSERNLLSIYPNGFNPLITSDISDTSLSFGIKSRIKGWNIDFNNTFGSNNFHYFIKETLNATLLKRSPTEFDAGGHKLTQNTTSVDFSKNFPSTLKGLNVAFGLEYRVENYKIFSGEEASYSSYDINGQIVNSLTPVQNLITYNNTIRPGGSQGFPGYSPKNEVDRSRNNLSLYIDTEFDFSKKWMIGTALRYEHYSDFGSTLNSKLATRINLTPKINLRSSFSTGFRAPSLAQIYYNLTFTNYIGNTATESLLVANNSPITKLFGIEKLKEEKAFNTSFGISFTPNNKFNFTIDTYYISIKDRIILSGNFDASNLGFNVENVQFFANGVNTSTIGLDIKTKWSHNFSNSKLSIAVFGNINNMMIQKINNKSLDLETFFGIREQYFLLASAPRNKLSLNLNYQKEKINLNINLTRFSSVQLIDWQILQDLSNFNNSKEERKLIATDFYKSKYTLDLHVNYQFTSSFTLQTGVNNLFNTYPTIQDNNTDSGGLWDSMQMGSNGTFYYSKLQFNF